MCLKQRLKQFGVGPFEGCTQQITSSILHTTKLAELLIYNQMECNDVKGRGWSELTQGLNMSFMCQSVTSHVGGVAYRKTGQATSLLLNGPMSRIF